MSPLLAEIGLRLAKTMLVGLLAAALYIVATGVLGEAGSITLALLCWISGALFWLLIETSPL